MSPNPQFPADLVTFNEEIFNKKLHFLCSVSFKLARNWTYIYMTYDHFIKKHFFICFNPVLAFLSELDIQNWRSHLHFIFLVYINYGIYGNTFMIV